VTDRPNEMDDRDVDERFASIVAAWDAPTSQDPLAAPDEAEPTLVGEDEHSTARESGDPTALPPGVNPTPFDLFLPASTWRTAPPAAPNPRDLPATDSSEDEDEDDGEHFVPPEVVLPPQEDLHFWGAVLGMVAGPLLLLYAVIAQPFHSTWWIVGGIAAFLGGFGLLVLRSPARRDPDDYDDGARV
jgi:hypothetical protein